MAFLGGAAPGVIGFTPPRWQGKGRRPVPEGDLSPASPVYSGSWLNRFSPSPRPPSPLGKGETLSLFCRGLRPRPPATAPDGTRRTGRVPVPGVSCPRCFRQPTRQPANLPAQPRGCKGRSPLQKITKNSPPSPLGKGVGGWGRKTLTGGRTKQTNAGDRHPGGAGNLPVRRAAPGARLGTPQTARQPENLPVQSRGCKGRSPLHKKTKKLPLPRRGRGSGGWGRKTLTGGRVKQTNAGDRHPVGAGNRPERRKAALPQNPPGIGTYPRSAYASSREAAVWAAARRKEG